jgi:hypothetical protein
MVVECVSICKMLLHSVKQLRSWQVILNKHIKINYKHKEFTNLWVNPE